MRRFFLLGMAFLFFRCSGEGIDFQKYSPAQKRIRTELTYLKDGFGRYVYINGLNVSCSSKFPTYENPISFVGKPFPLEEADNWFAEIERLGFNAIRLLVIWEAIEHEGKGKYDVAYLDYIEEIVKKANERGLLVLIDMHQDIFSRHLTVNYNENPPYGEKGSLEYMLLSLLPPYTDKVRGDGAPKWAVQACLREKNLDSEKWGIYRSLGSFSPEAIVKIIELYHELFPSEQGGGVEVPKWVEYFVEKLKEIGEFDVTESSDMLPFTFWGMNAALSLDVERSFACFFAGDKVYPEYKIEGQSVKDYLQEAYINAFLEVVKRVKKYPNIIGYDLMNEPMGIFVMLSAVTAYFKTGLEETVKSVLTNLLGAETGKRAWDVILALNLLPPDRSPETMKKWGFDGIDLLAVLELNYGFDRKYLQPFYEKLGKRIQEEDPDALIWIQMSGSIQTLLPPGGMWEINMTKPEGVNQVVFAPHWYPDIYPYIGLNMEPRSFTPEEIRFRDYEGTLKAIAQKSAYSLGNVPVVLGEFGTYFNFNGIEESIKNNYEVSAHILDNYYEALESLVMHRMLWCFSPENHKNYGDGWNKEDFSIIDFNRKPRGEKAFSRPYPRVLSGKPVSMRFYSDYHYFDPDKGIVNPLHEFELRFESKETDAPTEIFVPEIQYSDGFYVYLSDGYAVYDHPKKILYYFPTEDSPEHIHTVTIRDTLPGHVQKDWDYFFYKDMTVNGK